MNSVVDVNLVVYKFSGVYENTVVCKSSVKMVDKNSVVAQFSGVDMKHKGGRDKFLLQKSRSY